MAAYEQLRELYYSPESGLTGATAFVRKAKERGINLTVKQIKEWHQKQVLSQLFEKKKKPFLFHIFAYDFGYLISDLIDLQKFSRTNKNNKFILSIMDLKSRYAWLFPVKSKEPKELLPHIQKVIEEMKQHREELARLGLRPVPFPIAFITDSGTEYKGVVDRFLKENDIRHIAGNPADNTKRRTANVERLHRTILDKFRKIFELEHGTNWINHLPSVTRNYNNTFHRSIGARPADVLAGRAESKEKRRRGVPPSFEVGDRVRVELPLDTFEKRGRVLRYSREVYTVEQKIGNLYLLNNEVLYLPDQLKLAAQEQAPERNREMVQANQHARAVRKARQEIAVGHEGRINEEGNVELKERLQPRQAKRQPVPNRQRVE